MAKKDYKKVEVKVGNVTIHLVLGHNYTAWEKKFGEDENIWDFLFEELIDGTIEPREDIWYWYIGGRCYETDEQV